jgi:hypothetical protein
MTTSGTALDACQAELQRLDDFAQAITLSMSTAAKEAGYGTENGKLLGRWYHAVNGELGRIRRVFLRQADENAAVVRQLDHPIVYPEVKVAPHSAGLQLRVAVPGRTDAIAETTQITPELLRTYGAAFLAIADQFEQMQAPEHPDHGRLLRGAAAAAEAAARHTADEQRRA